jgi:hypothetical protein
MLSEPGFDVGAVIAAGGVAPNGSSLAAAGFVLAGTVAASVWANARGTIAAKRATAVTTLNDRPTIVPNAHARRFIAD